MIGLGTAFDKLKEGKFKGNWVVGFFLDLVEIIVYALILLAIFFVFFDIRKVPSGSMIPNVQINDRVFFQKASAYAHSINRGDVVMFDATEVNIDKNTGSYNNFLFKWMPWVNPKEVDYLKRVIAVGGDKFSMKGGDVYINGKKFKPSYKVVSGDTYSTDGTITVPKGYVFVMGDNRTSSYDSREWSGAVSDIQANKVKGFKTINGITFVSLNKIKAKAVFAFNLGKFSFKGL